MENVDSKSKAMSIVAPPNPKEVSSILPSVDGSLPSSPPQTAPTNTSTELPQNSIEKEQYLKDLLKEKQFLLNENRLLQDHLMRVADRSVVHVEKGSESSNTEEEEDIPEYGSRSSLSQAHSSFVGDLEDPSTMRREPSFVPPIEELEEYNVPADLPFELPKLNAEDKNEIASKENAELHDAMELCKYSNEKLLDELWAAYDESQLRIGEVRRDRADFQRDVLSDAQNKGFKRANAHKVLKFLEAKIKYKVSKAKKVAERNQALQVDIMRTEKQLGMKKELADVLHAVDFEQLHIHKQQHQQRLHDKARELQRLKSSHAKASKALETSLHKLTDLISIRGRTLEDLSDREPQLARVKKDIHRVTLKKERIEELFHIFIQERDAQLGESQPNVLDYMQIKNKVHGLRQEYKTWTQKVEVAELCSQHASTHQSDKDAQSIDTPGPH